MVRVHVRSSLSPVDGAAEGATGRRDGRLEPSVAVSKFESGQSLLCFYKSKFPNKGNRRRNREGGRGLLCLRAASVDLCSSSCRWRSTRSSRRWERGRMAKCTRLRTKSPANWSRSRRQGWRWTKRAFLPPPSARSRSFRCSLRAYTSSGNRTPPTNIFLILLHFLVTPLFLLDLSGCSVSSILTKMGSLFCTWYSSISTPTSRNSLIRTGEDRPPGPSIPPSSK